MRKSLQHILFVIFTIVFATLTHSLQGALFFSAGPEIYHLDRSRVGGTWQQGMLYGVRGTFERIKPWGWYLGADYLWAEGQIKGNSSSGKALVSDIKDEIWEGRLGWAFQACSNRRQFFVPFGGFGHFCETNSFKNPSPIPFTFIDSFYFGSAGFLSGFNITPLLSMGINFKAMFMLNGTSQVKDDPDFESVTLKMRNEINTRVEIPITYRFSFYKLGSFVELSPFYEFRHFGGLEGYPFDFIDTEFNLFGAHLQIGLIF